MSPTGFDFILAPTWWRDWGPGGEDASPAEWQYGAVIIEPGMPRATRCSGGAHAVAAVLEDQERY